MKDKDFLDNTIYEELDNLYTFKERELRIYNEIIKPSIRFTELAVKDTIVFFGSAKIIDFDEVNRLKKDSLNGKRLSEQEIYKIRMAGYYKDAEVLAEKFTIWAKEFFKGEKYCIVCSGGGPGIMEAANRGAKKAGGKSIGLNIKIPYEQEANVYQTKAMKFMFHYFFTRKFWFIFMAKIMVVFPGGFGTLDELFETLTLLKTNKTKDPIPIVLYGKDYWNDIINFDAMVKWGTIDRDVASLIKICDNINEAFDYTIKKIVKTKV